MKLEKELKEVFDFYAKACDTKNKTITFTVLMDIINKIGIEVTKDDLKTLLRSMNNENSEMIPYNVFVDLFDKKLYKEVAKKDAVDAFRLFDKEGKGKIPIADFKQVLTNLAENLTITEIEDFLKLADQKKDGYIYYEEFVEFLSGA